MVSGSRPLSSMLNKVPAITLAFWVVKILSTTVGETLADFLNTRLGLGLVWTSALFVLLFLAVLYFQLRATRYEPPLYWSVVVIVSVVGTLITDTLVNVFTIPVEWTTIVFAVLLVALLSVWWYRERTLSMKSINTRRRELFYWAAIVLTFALGTSAGDQLAEAAKLGYALSALVFGGAIALVAVAHFAFRLDGVVAFWIAYVLTRPLGASLGDLLAQPRDEGGLGFGTTVTSVVFLAIIVVLVLRERRPPARV
jgi:uncharacterized membrane-anchored protein